MRRCSENTWFATLAPADAARIVVLCERIRLGEWLRLERTPTGRMAIRRDDPTRPPFEFGQPGEDLLTAVRGLHRRMSPLIVRRVKRERVFGQLLLLEAVRAWLNDDVDLAKGLMRRPDGNSRPPRASSWRQLQSGTAMTHDKVPACA